MSRKSQFAARNARFSALGRISLSGIEYDYEIDALPGMRVLGEYAIVYVFSGSGWYMDSNGIESELISGDMIVLFPDVSHAYGPVTGEKWSEFYLVFDGSVFDLWRERGLLDESEPIHHLEPLDYWLRRFESVLGAPHESGWAPPLLEICRLQEVLAEALLGGMKGTNRQEDIRWASRACVMLESDLSRSINLKDVARRVGTSYDSFRKRFTRTVGVSPGKYRSARIVDRACELMRQGDMSDKQIAGVLGYCDEFYFSRRFKEITGKSPREYRRNLPFGS